ncbi:MAG: AbrB/MazE/SpoVT family DNA-binding domain-containing protein [Firmicutes bacterium]|nr:AbrB/MazE/SpoVT family DNA-binding domain-containing protein [Bacillota bacterium]
MPLARARVTSKGQITVPRAIRRLLSVRRGDEIAFITDKDRVYVERIPGPMTADRVFGRLHRPGSPPVDADVARHEARLKRVARHRPGPEEPAE